ncbi:MAG TPA: hypothetical protein VK427_09555, partial [Kofleriaceae bacterium]|nr:hypothetical protein [Kofleriaceae bacterium]
MRWWWLLLLASCGDNTTTREPYEARSGDRIALRTFLYSDGTRQWDPTVYFDRERGERCTIQRWSDGNTYCTPPAVPTVYTEPTCVDGERGRWLSTQAPPTYFYREYTLIGGEVASRLFGNSGVVAAPAVTYELANGRCVETLADGWTYYALGEPLLTDAFARVRHVRAEGTERLGLDVYTTDDGLYVPAQAERPLLRDRVLDDECQVVAQPNQPTTACEPRYAGAIELSRDASCATKDVLVTEATTQVPEVIVVETDGCRHYARRGAEIAHVPLFLPLDSSCIAVSPPADAHLFEIGSAFDVPVMTRRSEVAPERRLQRVLVSDGQTTVVDSLLHDRELGIDCVRTEVGDSFRCLPANTFATVLAYFRDPA